MREKELNSGVNVNGMGHVTDGMSEKENIGEAMVEWERYRLTSYLGITM